MVKVGDPAPDFVYGCSHFGNERTTFIIGDDGRVSDVLRRVKRGEQDEQVLAGLERTARGA